MMEWLATDRLEMANLATPPDRVTVFNTVVPSLNVMAPVGVPAPGALGVTVAVKVTDCPQTAEIDVDASVVVVVAWLTVCVLPPLPP